MEIIRSVSAAVSKRLKVNIIPIDWLYFLNADFRDTYSFLKEVETWSADDVYSWQFLKLKRIITSAYNGTEAYRELYRSNSIYPSDIGKLADIKNLPKIDKIFVKENFGRLINKSSGRSVVRYTGGSTGTPMKFLLDKQKIFQEKAFFYYFWKLFFSKP